MLIPSIDIQDGAVVQLVQGERLAIKDEDVSKWVSRFKNFAKVQVIDLDAAKGAGDNLGMVRQIAGELNCRVGGGIRSVERARDLLDAGAQKIIVGSALFKNGQPDLTFAKAVADAVGREQVIAAVDSRDDRVVINGWKTAVSIGPVDAVSALEPYCDEFLFTNVEREGLMRGTDIDAILGIRHATTRRVTAAGGIATQQEIDLLDSFHVDAVVGMAIYTGSLELPT